MQWMERRDAMIWVVLILAIILFGLGFTVKALLWVGLILFVLWLLGWVVRPGGSRWYYW
jgi:hypothetical protein